ncbi:hypothetical protein, partial [Staphylococcus epidermidis]|uniref:hypothetical protein n=1 Tax=Staphylococcus epidermidis TaxID=1282 RepID=UPI001C932480
LYDLSFLLLVVFYDIDLIIDLIWDFIKRMIEVFNLCRRVKCLMMNEFLVIYKLVSVNIELVNVVN